ncbi:MAG TPA: chromosomal replication initiator protein DnaA [Acidimicrobiia bacterium]|nr:chromosomal replication initiator protein DnaA [Acidimicrobiia bacterium]
MHGFSLEEATSRQWEEFQTTLRGSVSPANWQKWLGKLQPELGSSQVTLIAPNEFHRTWVEEKHGKQIESIFRQVFGSEMTISLVALSPYLPAEETEAPAPEAGPAPTHPSASEVEPRYETNPSPLFGRYRFESFIQGESNQFALAAAQAVADQPGVSYNPLFIFGGAGLGKTHLLHAVGHHVHEFYPSLLVRYVTSEKFLNDFIDCIRRKRVDDFKHRYRSTDVLLLDDVQFFERKEQILEEFFHTFNTLHQLGKQLVITSDRHPRNFTVEDRLRSRFEWGLVTDIQPPLLETRLAILKRGAEFAPKRVPQEVLEYIASSVSDNIRELEGALTRVTAFAALTHREIDLAMAEKVLGDHGKKNGAPLQALDIIAATADSYGFSVAEVQGPSRRQPLVLCRQVGMYLCRELTDLSLPKIGEVFGGRDHTTVIHSLDKVKRVIRSDRAVFDRVHSLLQQLRKRGA